MTHLRPENFPHHRRPRQRRQASRLWSARQGGLLATLTWGAEGTLHIDCWAEIDHADGYDVELREEPFRGRERLFFVNLGGYDPAEFAEQHRNMFVVAESVTEAKARAMATIPTWKDGHRDDFYEAEKAFAMDGMVEPKRHIHLIATGEKRPLRFTCRYAPLK
jgi:hypothetical protein